MSEPVHVEVEVPPAESHEESQPAVTVVETGGDSGNGVSDGTLAAMLELQERLSILEAENNELRSRVAAAEVAAEDAAITAEIVAEETAEEIAEIAEEVAESQAEPEPDIPPRRPHWTERRLF